MMRIPSKPGLRLAVAKFFGYSPFNFISLTQTMRPVSAVFEVKQSHVLPELTEVRNIFREGTRSHYSGARSEIELKDGVIYSDQALIYTGNELVAESTTWPPETMLLLYGRPKKVRKKIAGTFIPLGSNSYYHWLIETLPSALRSWRQAKPEAKFLVHKKRKKFVDDFLSLSKIPYEIYSRPACVENLVFGDRQGILGHPSKSDIVELRDFVLENVHANRIISSDQTIMIYVSRRKSARTHPFEIELEFELTKNGFVTVFCEDLPWAEQIKLFSEASVVVGIHGAGLSNVVFMRKGGLLIELLDPKWPNNCFEILAQKTGVRFSRIILNETQAESQQAALLLSKEILQRI